MHCTAADATVSESRGNGGLLQQHQAQGTRPNTGNGVYKLKFGAATDSSDPNEMQGDIDSSGPNEMQGDIVASTCKQAPNCVTLDQQGYAVNQIHPTLLTR